jgi:hypothetical protein
MARKGFCLTITGGAVPLNHVRRCARGAFCECAGGVTKEKEDAFHWKNSVGYRRE